MRPRSTPRAGFTLIEMIVVIAIMSIIVGAAIPVTSKALTYTARKETRSELQGLADASTEYFRDTLAKPAQVADLLVDPSVSGWSGPYLPGVVADVQQTPSGNLLLGVTWEPGSQDTDASAHNLRATAQRVCRVLPFMEQVRVIRAFSGVRPVPHDMVSYLGPTRHCPGLVVALTHSGITLAPLLACVVADAFDGATHAAWHPSFCPDRALEVL